LIWWVCFQSATVNDADLVVGGEELAASAPSLLIVSTVGQYASVGCELIFPSSRWIAPLLTYTIPVPGILLAWDAIFARPPRERDRNYRLEFLVDVTSAMLIALRRELLQ